jgi:hypothetical protein
MTPDTRSTLTRPTETAIARVRATMSESRRRQQREGRFTRTASGTSATTRQRAAAVSQWMTPDAASAMTTAPRTTR